MSVEPETIEVRNIGPVEELDIPLPEAGVIVLLGPNDCGKSVMISAVDRLAGNTRAGVECRDRTGLGTIAGLGVQLSVRKSPRVNGQLEAAVLSGKLSIGDLVDPGLMNPEKADARRIKALVQLSGVEPDASLFHELAGGKEAFDRVVSPSAMVTDCPVEMAAKVHRAFLAERKSHQSEAERSEQHEAACREAIGDTDLTADHDAEALQAELSEAMQEGHALSAQRDAAARARVAAAKAREQLSVAAAEYSGLTTEVAATAVADTGAALDEAMHLVASAREEVEKAQRQLDSASDEVEQRRRHHEEAQRHRAHAVQHEHLLAGCREAIDTAADVTPPGEEAVTEASRKLRDAQAAVERGVLVRRALEKDRARKLHGRDARESRESAAFWDAAAAGTDEVLSRMVNSDAMTVREGRLMTVHPTRGEVFYGKRSDGTRCVLAVMEAIRRIKREHAEQTGLIPLPQWIWEGLDPANRERLAECAVKHNVRIITAEAADGPLRSEVFVSTTKEGAVREDRQPDGATHGGRLDKKT